MVEDEVDQLQKAIESLHRCSARLVQSVPIKQTHKRRFFAVLHQPPVTSPSAAVRAAIMAEHGQK